MKNMEHTSDDNFSTVKYLIKISYNIKGIVSVMDIIGALFGQTEGLLNDLELLNCKKAGVSDAFKSKIHPTKECHLE